jgi:hypothetical protein
MSTSSLQSLIVRARIEDRTRALSEDAQPLARNHRATTRFLRHYVEMVVVMFAGMFVLMAPVGWLFGAFGTSWSRLSPAMNVFAMALTMTAPMVAWMYYRGHAWRVNAEMAASMLIPTFVVMGVLWTGAAKSGLMVPEHIGMLACMLVAMLLRRDEYSCAGHAHHRGGQVDRARLPSGSDTAPAWR